jgi:hypothetical protein
LKTHLSGVPFIQPTGRWLWPEPLRLFGPPNRVMDIPTYGSSIIELLDVPGIDRYLVQCKWMQPPVMVPSQQRIAVLPLVERSSKTADHNPVIVLLNASVAL